MEGVAVVGRMETVTETGDPATMTVRDMRTRGKRLKPRADLRKEFLCGWVFLPFLSVSMRRGLSCNNNICVYCSCLHLNWTVNDRLTVGISTSRVWNLLHAEDVHLHTPALQTGTHFLLTLETVVFLFHLLLSATSKPFSSLSTRLAHAASLGSFTKTCYIYSLIIIIIIIIFFTFDGIMFYTWYISLLAGYLK